MRTLAPGGTVATSRAISLDALCCCARLRARLTTVMITATARTAPTAAPIPSARFQGKAPWEGSSGLDATGAGASGGTRTFDGVGVTGGWAATGRSAEEAGGGWTVGGSGVGGGVLGTGGGAGNGPPGLILTVGGRAGGAVMVEEASVLSLEFFNWVPRLTRRCLESPTASWISKSLAHSFAISSSRKKMGFSPASSLT